jgi:hypothetical protein
VICDSVLNPQSFKTFFLDPHILHRYVPKLSPHGNQVFLRQEWHQSLEIYYGGVYYEEEEKTESWVRFDIGLYLQLSGKSLTTF